MTNKRKPIVTVMMKVGPHEFDARGHEEAVQALADRWFAELRGQAEVSADAVATSEAGR